MAFSKNIFVPAFKESEEYICSFFYYSDHFLPNSGPSGDRSLGVHGASRVCAQLY